jgi:hypothetical protein
MPNYNITQCLTNNEYVISATTLGVGDTIGFYIGEDTLCGVVGDITSNPPTPLSFYNGDVFSDCCDCLSATTDSLNFRFIVCDTLEEINIEGGNFCREYGLPISGKTYEIQYGSDTSFCARFTELSPSGQTNYFYVGGPFNDCVTCQSGGETISAGTYDYTVCVICDEGGTETAVSVEVPHPSYTNAIGQNVIQTQMVTLGGFNGLNS